MTAISSDQHFKSNAEDIFDGLVVGGAVELLDSAREDESVQCEKFERKISVTARFESHVPVEEKVLQCADGRGCE